MLFFHSLFRVSTLCVTTYKVGLTHLNVRALCDKKFCYATVQNGTLKAPNLRRKKENSSLRFHSHNHCFIRNNVIFQRKINYTISMYKVY